jgi:hypothetical protein
MKVLTKSPVPVPVVGYEEGGEEKKKKTLDQDLVGLGFFNTGIPVLTLVVPSKKEKGKTTA